MTNNLDEPSLNAGDNGVFCLNPPSTYGMPSMETGGKTKGMAAEAWACF